MGRSTRHDRGRDFWAAAIARWRGSGESVAGFCRREGLAVSTFYLWRGRLGEAGSSEDAAATFVPVRVGDALPAEPTAADDDDQPTCSNRSARNDHLAPSAADASAARTPIDLVLGSTGLSVRLHGNFDRTALAQLLEMLDDLPGDASRSGEAL